MPNNINVCLKAQKAKNNEFYTEYKTMEYLFESEEQGSQFRNFVKDKVIYLPCDTENSNILKYLTNNKEALQIKEIIHTSDDYYGHLDLYEKADLVFTNPPFTKLRQYADWLDNMNKKFVLWWSWMSICFNRYPKLINGEWKILTKVHEIDLYSPNNNNKCVNCLIFTNIEDAKIPDKEMYLTYDLNNAKQYNGIPYVDNVKQYPKDYYGQIYIPFTGYLAYIDKLEYIDSVRDYFGGVDRLKVLVKRKIK